MSLCLLKPKIKNMKIKFLSIMALAAALVGCSNNARIDESNDPNYIGRNQMTITDGKFRLKYLWHLAAWVMYKYRLTKTKSSTVLVTIALLKTKAIANFS